MSEENKEYIKISQLQPTSTLNPDAMFMVSETTTSEGNYMSKRIAIGELSTQLQDRIINGIQQAVDTYGAVDKANSLNDITGNSQISAIVTVKAAREMYNYLILNSSPAGNYLNKDTNLQQTVTGPVRYQSNLSCPTVTDITRNDLLVVNCKTLRNNVTLGRYPFVGGYSSHIVSSFTGDGKENQFFVGFKDSCTANIKIYSPKAAYIGIALFCSKCVAASTVNELMNNAKNHPEDTSLWYPIEYFKMAANDICTRNIPCDKNTVLMFYAIKAHPSGVDDNSLFGGAKRVAILKNVKITVNQYGLPSEE